MHPALREQLAHARVDDRIAGQPVGPPVEPAPPLLPRLHRKRRELGPVGRPDGVGPVVEHVGVELAPGQLATECLVVGAEVGQHRSRVEGAEAQVDRRPRRGVEVGAVPLRGVRRPAPEERLPGPGRRLLAGLGQPSRARVGPAADLLPRDRQPVGPVGVGAGRGPPPVLQPGAVERSEDPVRVPAPVPDPPGRHGVRRPGRHQRHLTQRDADPLVAGGAVGREVRADVHRGSAHVGGDLGDDALRRTAADEEPRAHGPQVAVERTQGVRQEAAPRHPGPGHQPVVEDEERKHRPRGRCLDKRRVVVQPQIAAEPQHRCRHVTPFPGPGPT